MVEAEEEEEAERRAGDVVERRRCSVAERWAGDVVERRGGALGRRRDECRGGGMAEAEEARRVDPERGGAAEAGRNCSGAAATGRSYNGGGGGAGEGRR